MTVVIERIQPESNKTWQENIPCVVTSVDNKYLYYVFKDVDTVSAKALVLQSPSEKRQGRIVELYKDDSPLKYFFGTVRLENKAGVSRANGEEALVKSSFTGSIYYIPKRSSLEESFYAILLISGTVDKQPGTEIRLPFSLNGYRILDHKICLKNT